jgi:hypothetical protein
MELREQVPGPVDPERVQQMGQRAQAPTTSAHHPLDADYDSVGQNQPAPASVPSTGSPL